MLYLFDSVKSKGKEACTELPIFKVKLLIACSRTTD